MKITIEKLEKSRVKLIIDVSAEEAGPFLEKAAKEESKKHPVKGFRPGSVPLEMMRSVIGDEHLAERAMQELVPRTYIDALMKNEEIEAVGRPEVKITKAAVGGDWQYEAVVAVLPEIKLGDYKNLKAEKKPQTVEAEEVQKELDFIRRSRASFVAVPREAQMGDQMELDVVISEGGVPLEAGSIRKQTVQLRDGHLLPEFEKQVEGMKEGESKNFPITFPADYQQKDLQNKKVDFAVKVLSVQQQILPELNDHLAQGLGNFSGIEDFRKQSTDNIQKEKEEKERDRVRQTLVEQVVAKTTFGEIAAVLIGGEIDKMVHELGHGLESMGMQMDQYLQQIKKTPEQLREGFHDQAVTRIKSGLTLRALAKAENIEAEDSEIEEEVNKFLMQFPSIEEAKQKIDLDALTDVTASQIRNRKVLELLEKSI